MAQTRSRLLGDQYGVAFVEMLMAFVPTWVFSLCVFQLVLIARANLIVRHAADAAARSAAVVLPDDPGEYGGEPQMSIARNGITREDLSRAIGAVLSRVPTAQSTRTEPTLSGEAVFNPGRSRLNTIRLAAHVPLMPLAPINVGREPSPSIGNALGGKRALLSALFYQPFAVTVTFPNARGDFVDGPEVTVRVAYALQCSVPLARHILCKSFRAFEKDENWSRAFASIAHRFVEGRFREIVHESTLPLHAAPYDYRPRFSR